MAVSLGADREQHIGSVPPEVLARDEKADDSLGVKQEIVLIEKDASDVKISEPLENPPPNSPPKSRRERYVSFVRSLTMKKTLSNTAKVFWNYGRFMGPGAIISVAYIDPDNFQTALSSGAEFQFKLLFMILLSNVIAVFLQVSADIIEILFFKRLRV
jgi:hypothetical protein